MAATDRGVQRRRRSRPGVGQRGYEAPRVAGRSLIEILVFLAVLVISTIVAGPAIERWWRCYQLETETYEIATFFQKLWRQAGEESEVIVVLVDVENEEMVAFVDRVGDGGELGSDLELGPTEIFDQATGRTLATVDEVITRKSLRQTLAGRTLRLGRHAEDEDGTEAVEGFTGSTAGREMPRLVFDPTGELRDVGTLYFVLTPAEEGADLGSSSSFVAVDFAKRTTPSTEIKWYVSEPVGMAGYYPQSNLPEGAKCCF